MRGPEVFTKYEHLGQFYAIEANKNHRILMIED